MKIEIKEKTRVYDGFFKIDQVVIKHERFNGNSQTITRLCFERGDAVAAVVFDPKTRELLFTEQFRYPAYSRSASATMIELVAGMQEPDEQHLDCLKREVEEELGYELSSSKYLGCFFLSPGGSSERVHLYFAELGEKIGNGGGKLEENEDIRLLRLSQGDVKNLLQISGFNDAKTHLGLLISQVYWE